MAGRGRKKLGDLGEHLVVSRLQELGYRVVTTNWRCPIGEVDIIAWHDQCLTFIEVRTRRGNNAGTPEDSITRVKRLRLQNLVEAYLQAQREWLETAGEWPACRIDLAAVEFGTSGQLLRLQIHQNVIEAD